MDELLRRLLLIIIVVPIALFAFFAVVAIVMIVDPVMGFILMGLVIAFGMGWLLISGIRDLLQ